MDGSGRELDLPLLVSELHLEVAGRPLDPAELVYEVHVPRGAAELAIGGGLKPYVALHLDHVADRVVLDGAQLLGVDLPLIKLLSSSQQLGRSEQAAYVVGAERWLRPAPAWDRLVGRPRFGHCSILVNRAPSSVPDPDNGRVEANCRT